MPRKRTQIKEKEEKKSKDEKERKNEKKDAYGARVQELEPDEEANELLSYLDEDGLFKPPSGWKPPLRDLGEILANDQTGRVLVFNARKQCGKSFFIRYILYQKRHDVKTWFVFTNTKFNGFYQRECGICEKRIFNGVNMGVMQEILEKQKDRREEWDRGERGYSDMAIGIIMDDIGSEVNNMRYSDDFSKMMYDCRHYHVVTLVAEQYFKFVGPGPRKNTDYPVMFRPDSIDEGEDIRNTYFGFYARKDFQLAIQSYTTPMQLLDDAGNLVFRKGKTGKLSPVVVPICLCREMPLTSTKLHQSCTMFITYAPDPPPFITSGDTEWDVCREDPAEAYEKACDAYEKRIKDYVLKDGRTKPNLNVSYQRHLVGASLFSDRHDNTKTGG